MHSGRMHIDRSIAYPALAVALALLLVLACSTDAPGPEPVEDRFADQFLISHEAVPSAQGDRWGNIDFSMTSYSDRAALTSDVHQQLHPQIIDAINFDCATPETQETPGGYLLVTNPSLQSAVSATDCTQDEVERLAAALGYVYRQWDVLITDFSASEGGTGYATVAFPEGSLTPELAQDFFVFAASINGGLGGGYTAFDDAMLFLNLRDTVDGSPYSGLEDAEFIAALETAADEFAQADVVVESAAEGELEALFVSNDWASSPEGEDFAAMLDDAELVILDELRVAHDQLVLDR